MQSRTLPHGKCHFHFRWDAAVCPGFVLSHFHFQVKGEEAVQSQRNACSVACGQVWTEER